MKGSMSYIDIVVRVEWRKRHIVGEREKERDKERE